MDETTATHHKEWIEEKKDEIDAQIASMRKVRDDAEDNGNYTLVALMDKGIDDLLTEKDNITTTLSDDDPRTPAERAADDFQDEYSNDATINDIRAGFQQW